MIQRSVFKPICNEDCIGERTSIGTSTTRWGGFLTVGVACGIAAEVYTTDWIEKE